MRTYKKQNVIIKNDNKFIIPEKICINFNDHVNIIRINRIVTAKIKENYGDESQKYLKEYRNKSNKYLNIYKKLIYSKKKISFFSDQENCEDEVELNIIISRYIYVASHYIKMEITLKKLNENIYDTCPCGFDIENVQSKDGMTKICPECSLVNKNFIKPQEKFLSGNEKLNIKMYDNKPTFLSHLTRYQGKVVPNIDIMELSQKLDIYFLQNNIPDTKEIKKIGKPYKGNINTLLIALNKIGFQEHYKDVRYVSHIIWLWPLPDIDDIEDLIISIYDEVQDIWKNIPPDIKKRRSNLPAEYFLYRILQLVSKTHISSSDFKLPNTESIEECDRCWKIICFKSKNPNIYYVY